MSESKTVQPTKISNMFTTPQNRQNPAKWAHERLVKSIIDFEKNLDENHEIGGRLVSFSEGESFHIDDIGYWGPDFIIFYGAMADGSPVELIQHLTQVNVMLVAIRKQEEQADPRRIGFKLAEGLSEDDEEEEEAD